MKTFLKDISQIVQAKKVICPEHAIQSVLIPFPELFKNDNTPLEEIEKHLLGLLKVNNGNLGPQCCYSIANCLILIYQKEKNHRFWNLINQFNKAPTNASIYTLGRVVSKLGHFSKSSLPSVVQQMLLLKEPFHFAVIHSLYSFYKVCKNELDKHVPSCFKLIKWAIKSSNESLQLSAIKLLSQLIGLKSAPCKKLLKFANFAYSYSTSPFVIDYISYFIALFTVLLHIKREKHQKEDDQQTDFTLSKTNKKGQEQSPLVPCFEIISSFSAHSSTIFSYFLDLLEPEFVYSNSTILFKFALQISPNDIYKVAAFFSNDIRGVMYSSIANSKNPDFTALKVLTHDDDTARETGGMAMSLITSKKMDERNQSVQYFISICHQYPVVAAETIHLCIHYLAMPPDDHPSLEKEINQMAQIVSILLFELPDLYFKEKKLFVQFISNCSLVLPLLTVLSAIPKSEMKFADSLCKEIMFEYLNSYVPKLEKSLSPKTTNSDSSQEGNEFQNEQMPRLSRTELNTLQTLLVFVSTRSKDPRFNDVAAKTFSLAFAIRDQLTLIGLNAILQSYLDVDFPDAENVPISFYFLNKLLESGLSVSFIREQFPFFMKLYEECITGNPTKKTISSKEQRFFTTKSTFSISIYQQLPFIFKSLGPEERKHMFKLIFNNECSSSSQMALYSVYSSPFIKEIPQEIDIKLLNSLSVIAKKIKKEKYSQHEQINLIVQIICETIAIATKANKFSLDKLLHRKRDFIKPFLISALARQLQFTDQQIMDILIEATMQKDLSNLERDNYLYELSVLYETKIIQLTALQIGDQQCQLLLNILRDNSYLTPYRMMLIVTSLKKLLPILLPVLWNEDTKKNIIMALETFRLTPLPYIHTFFLSLSRSLVGFAIDLSTQLPVHYPHSFTRPLDERLAILGSLFYTSKINKISVSNALNILPETIVLVQRTKDPRVINYIIRAAELASYDDLPRWFQFLKQVLSQNSMIGFGENNLEPNQAVKQCALAVGSALLPTLAKLIKNENKNGKEEGLDDLIAASLRAIQTKTEKLASEAYTLLKNIIDLFGDLKSNQNVPILEMYGSQFDIASSAAFPRQLDIASGFLRTYLEFSFKNSCESKNFSDLISMSEPIIDGITHLKVYRRKEGYYSISSKICEIARNSPDFMDQNSSFFKFLFPSFNDFVLNLIKLKKQEVHGKNFHHSKIHIRTFMAPYYLHMYGLFGF